MDIRKMFLWIKMFHLDNMIIKSSAKNVFEYIFVTFAPECK